MQIDKEQKMEKKFWWFSYDLLEMRYAHLENHRRNEHKSRAWPLVAKVRADCPKSRKLLPGLVKRVSASKHSFFAIHFQSYSLDTFQEYYPSHKWWIKDEFKSADTFWKVNPSKSQNLHISHMLSSSKGKNSFWEYLLLMTFWEYWWFPFFPNF